MESYFFLQQALFRIRESPFMLGGNYFFGKTEVTVFEESKLPEVDPQDFEVTNTGIGLIGEYETFNNVLYDAICGSGCGPRTRRLGILYCFRKCMA